MRSERARLHSVVAPGTSRCCGPVAAVALHARLGVAEMVDLDLAYAPPFSPVWDPVQTAARVLEGKLSERYPAAPAPMKV